MKKLLFIPILLLLCAKLVPQIEQTGIAVEELYVPIFNYEIVNFSEYNSTSSRLDIFIQVPFNVIKFVKAQNGIFKAEYSVTISIFNDKKDKLHLEKTWNEKVESPDYEQTISTTNYQLGIRSFILTPGNYVIKIEVEDRDSRKKHSIESPKTVRNFNSQFSLSDLIFIDNKHWSNDIKKIFQITQLDTILPIFDDLESAKSYLN